MIFQWEQVAVCGFHPEERYWCSPIVDQTKLCILGGHSEKVYNDGVLHILQLDHAKVELLLQDKKNKVDTS